MVMKDITEGRATFLVPKKSLTRKAEAFYNPEMEYQRDITMSALRAYQVKAGHELSVCDPLAGTGVRSVRMALEVPGIADIAVNDANPKAFELIERNIAKSKLAESIRVDATNGNANMLFLENPRRFDYIDIDPFGSPINFIFNSGYALRPKSVLACTATDTGALCGSFPSTCFTRYGIKAVKTDFFKETGIRVLTTAIMLELARHDIAYTPLYSHSNHYFRVMGMAVRSKSKLSAQFRKIGFASYCGSCLFRAEEAIQVCPKCGKRMSVMGPLWLGPMHDKDFCTKMLDDLRSRDYRRAKELETCIGEIAAPFYYDLPKVFKLLRKPPRKMEDVIMVLKGKGHSTSRTHLSDTGLITDAPYEDVLIAAGA
jgi:tRNA (guanine26-N2/guanine27-N2)-dimethyltransferase